MNTTTTSSMIKSNFSGGGGGSSMPSSTSNSGSSTPSNSTMSSLTMANNNTNNYSSSNYARVNHGSGNYATLSTTKNSPRVQQLLQQSEFVVTNNQPQQPTVNNNEEYLNKKIAFIQNHINNLLIEITNLPEPWTYAVTEDGRVFFINEKEQRTTWLHPNTNETVGSMIIPPLEDLPSGWQKDYMHGMPYLIDHNTKKNYPLTVLSNKNSTESSTTTTSNASSNNTSTDSDTTKTDNNYTELMKLKQQHNNKSSMLDSGVGYTNHHHHQSDVLFNHSRVNELKQQQQSSSYSNYHHQSSDSGHQSDEMLTSVSASPANSNVSSSSNNNSNLMIMSSHQQHIEKPTIQMKGSAIDSAVRKYGWLYKLSQNGLKLWRKRYFVLTDYILDYYSDSTMSKHCGTIFLNSTHSRPTVKAKDGSAFNKKNSFKVELVKSDDEKAETIHSDTFIYLAAESNASMSEWINKFNFVSKLKNNSQNRISFYEKNNASNRSSSNISARAGNVASANYMNNQANYFMIKHNGQHQQSDNTPRGVKQSRNHSSEPPSKSKSNSAPNSPNMSAKKSNGFLNLGGKIASGIMDSAKSKHSTVNDSKSKLRPSISTSSYMLDEMAAASTSKKKKKLAFSDENMLNDEEKTSGTHLSLKDKSKKNKKQPEQNENEYGGDNKSDFEYKQELRQQAEKRSVSLTRPIGNVRSASSSNNTGHGDLKSNLYEAFEKPIEDRMMPTRLNTAPGKKEKNYSTIQSLITSTSVSSNMNKSAMGYNSLKHDAEKKEHKRHQSNSSMAIAPNYIDRDKIAAAEAAAEAAAAAINNYQNRSDLLLMSKSMHSLEKIGNQNAKKPVSATSSPASQLSTKPINNFYNIEKSQIDALQINEAPIVVQQLKKIFQILNHAHQRFSLLQTLYEPYEIIYQHRQNQPALVNNKLDEKFSMMNELTNCIHDSYQAIIDRVKRLEARMNKVESIVKLVECKAALNTAALNAGDAEVDVGSITQTKHALILKGYDYQICQLQHEYELYLEDKIIVERLLETQMQIFNKQKSFYNEKNLVHQYDALNQELEFIQSNLLTANQQLSEKISEKCRQELNISKQNSLAENNKSSLFRASLVAVGNDNNSTARTTTSIPGSPKTNLSLDSIPSKINYHQPQLKTTIYKQNGAVSQPPNKYNTSLNPLNNKKAETNSSQQYFPSLGAFNAVNKKTATPTNSDQDQVVNTSTDNGSKLEQSDTADKEIQIVFQPVNFTNSRPRQLNIVNQSNMDQQQQQNQQHQIHQPVIFNQNSAFVPKIAPPAIKRDLIAEKKRSSIGKYPNTLPVKPNEYFKPIVQTQTGPASTTSNSSSNTVSSSSQQMQQSARARLFGGNLPPQAPSIHQSHLQMSHDNLVEQNYRKVASTSSNGDILQEYFNEDYSEEIDKTIQKPEVYQIPRGTMDIEPDEELTEEERKQKEKRVNDIKKMIAIQSLQSHVDESQASANDSYTVNANQSHQQYYSTAAGADKQDFNFEKEKKAREHLLDLRHELTEQIKEKQRQQHQAAMMMHNQNNSSSFNSSNLGSTSLSPSSVELDNNHRSERPAAVVNNSGSNIYLSSPSSNDQYGLEFVRDILNVFNTSHLAYRHQQILNQPIGSDPITHNWSDFYGNISN